MKTAFLFFVADHLLVGQLCTYPKSDRSLQSCLKVTQCSTSEIGDAPLYNSWSLLIQVMTTGPLPAPSKCKSGRFNASDNSLEVVEWKPKAEDTARKTHVAVGLGTGPQVQRDQGLASEGVLRLCTLLS